MNWADWGILGIIAISSLFSLKRGFTREALSLVTWVAAFIIARVFSDALAIFLTPYIETPSIRLVASFAILFIATLIVGAVVNNLFSLLIDATGLTGTDRILGMGFGIARGGLLVIVLIALVGLTPAVNDLWWKESTLIPHFKTMESWTRMMGSDIGQIIWSAGQSEAVNK